MRLRQVDYQAYMEPMIAAAEAMDAEPECFEEHRAALVGHASEFGRVCAEFLPADSAEVAALRDCLSRVAMAPREDLSEPLSSLPDLMLSTYREVLRLGPDLQGPQRHGALIPRRPKPGTLRWSEKAPRPPETE